MMFSWPLSNVGRVPMFVIAGYASPSMFAVVAYTPGRRHELVLGAQIRRRKAQLAAPLLPLHHRAVQRVVMTEQRSRFVDPPFGNQPAHARAADDEVFVADGIDFLRAEPVSRAETAQQ